MAMEAQARPMMEALLPPLCYGDGVRGCKATSSRSKVRVRDCIYRGKDESEDERDIASSLGSRWLLLASRTVSLLRLARAPGEFLFFSISFFPF